MKDFYHIWGGGHLVHVTQILQQTFVPPTQGGSTLNLALIGQVVSEKMFEIVNGQRMDGGLTPEHGYTVSSPMSLGSDELIKAWME